MSGIPSFMFLQSVGLRASDANKLAKMNDKGATFQQIADYIEKNL